MNSIVIIGSTILITLSLFSLFVNVVQIFGEITQEQESGINKIIQDTMNKCYDELEKKTCLSLVTTIDQLCRIAYFEACFGSDQWNPFLKHLKEKYVEQGEDPYVTLNQEHYGSSSMKGNNSSRDLN